MKNLVGNNSTMISPELTNQINDLIKNRVELISQGKLEVQPEILKLLDLGLYLSKYNLLI